MILDAVGDVAKVAFGIFVASIPLLIPWTRDLITKKIQLSFDKALENKKSINERKNYVSRIKFDKEFKIYTELSENTLDAVFETAEVVNIFNNGFDANKFAQVKQDIAAKYNVANKLLQKYAPFINVEIYDSYSELFCLFRKLLTYSTFLERGKQENDPDNSGLEFQISIAPSYMSQVNQSQNEKVKTMTSTELEMEISRLCKEISNKSDDITKKLREYLQSLEVIK